MLSDWLLERNGVGDVEEALRHVQDAAQALQACDPGSDETVGEDDVEKAAHEMLQKKLATAQVDVHMELARQHVGKGPENAQALLQSQERVLEALDAAEQALEYPAEMPEEQKIAGRQRWRAAVLRRMAEDCGAVGERTKAVDRWRRVVKARQERER
eukprot:SAG31_NODE_15238_length_764_cov_0.951880_2_plen_157_part_00